MTEIVSTPAAPEVPHYPALGSANFNQEAYTYGSSMPGVSLRIWEIGKAAETNAIAAGEREVAAGQSAQSASDSATAAGQSATAAGQSEGNALAYAQAAGASAGVPTPLPDKYLGTDAEGNPVWVDVPEDARKLDAVGGLATALGYSYKDHGTIAAGATAVIYVQEAAIHRVQAGGNFTLAFEGWATDGRSEEIEIHGVNLGGKTGGWPAGFWLKSDGSHAAAVGNSGVTWQTAGTDRVLVMRDDGVIFYKVMR